MRSSCARRNLPALITLVALLALVLAAAPVAAQEEDLGVECDHEDEHRVFFLFSGETLACLAFGLEPEVEAKWEADFYDQASDSFPDEPVLSDSDSFDIDQEGKGDFEIDIPAEPRVLWMEAVVVQGELELEFYGTTHWVLRMDCEPDPVELGGSVECFPEELTEGAFGWYVIFYDADHEELEDHEIEGDGTADAEGMGAFAFDVPDDDAIVAYDAVAEQADDIVALFEGEVVAAAEPPVVPAPTPQPTIPAPVAVPQPTRVDTGAGGTAPDAAAWQLLGLAGLAAAGAFALRRRASTTL